MMLYGKYRFRCCFESEAILPAYKGSTFRGVFGHALKKVVCPFKDQTCASCRSKEKCVYAIAFETRTAVNLPKNSIREFLKIKLPGQRLNNDIPFRQ